ncbi:MAG: hypothetical protein WA885_01205 [Phormidesmis sp.]
MGKRIIRKSVKKTIASRPTREGFPIFSMLLFLLANMAFGFFLHSQESSNFGWWIAFAYVILECSVLSIAWQQLQQFLLLGFKSDVGYSLMALGIASLAVIIVTWVEVSAYFLMLICAALLLRIKLYTRRNGTITSFVIMVLASFVGLAISWLPTLASNGRLGFFAGYVMDKL